MFSLRAALKGGTATVAAIATAGPSTAAPFSEEEARLQELARQHDEVYASWVRATDQENELQGIFFKTRPAEPAGVIDREVRKRWEAECEALEERCRLAAAERRQKAIWDRLKAIKAETRACSATTFESLKAKFRAIIDDYEIDDLIRSARWPAWPRSKPAVAIWLMSDRPRRAR